LITALSFHILQVVHHRCGRSVLTPSATSTDLAMSTEIAVILLRTLSVTVFFALLGCAGEQRGTSDVSRDHKAISALLEAAMLSDQPAREFRAVLPKVRAFPSVDSAWTDGISFFVKYREGGTVAWTAPPQPMTKP
jgi:hypothetical protein